LQYFEQLQEVDTLETVPTSQTTGLTSVLGKDELNTFTVFSQEQALMNAPSTHNGFFVVKGVFQDEG
jgi:Asp-tRNA(Asn)/Glu-tRNA(Gln) amidotransferase C subunit